MAKVKDVISWLKGYDQEEEIALTGWWTKADVENNNDVKLTDEQWETVVWRHEDNTEIHIDDVVQNLIEEEADNG